MDCIGQEVGRGPWMTVALAGPAGLKRRRLRMKQALGRKGVEGYLSHYMIDHS